MRIGSMCTIFDFSLFGALAVDSMFFSVTGGSDLPSPTLAFRLGSICHFLGPGKPGVDPHNGRDLALPHFRSAQAMSRKPAPTAPSGAEA